MAVVGRWQWLDRQFSEGLELFLKDITCNECYTKQIHFIGHYKSGVILSITQHQSMSRVFLLQANDCKHIQQ